MVVADAHTQGFSLAQYLEVQKTIVETALDQSLVVAEPVTIYEAMRYSLLAGGEAVAANPLHCRL